MKYTLDPDKNRRNVSKHKIAFEDAVLIFQGPTLEKEDDQFNYGETRIYAMTE